MELSELVNTWLKVVVAYFMMLPGGTEDDKDVWCLSRVSNRRPLITSTNQKGHSLYLHRQT